MDNGLYTVLNTYNTIINYNTIYELKIDGLGNNNYNFYFDDILIWENYNLNDANLECIKRYNTTLASIHSNTENNLAYLSININTGSAWIGFSDIQIENNFEW